ncbi:MAG TPA: shikimate dehydrogenase [Candidatus Limnocylindria bacterium]|nr:shikimate dehydrogenase [Candidatus Limnocylindria bacterium]
MARVALLGHPVAHSLSPAMHNAAFAALGLPHSYEVRDVTADRLAAAIDALRGDEWLGANVTVPHKETALRSMDETGADARAIGAVNTIVRRAGRLVGENTDRAGFAQAIAPRPVGCRVLVLGAGGAARAVVAELAHGNELVIASRRPAQAASVIATVLGPDPRATAVAWSAVAGLEGIDVLVNATPLGLHGEDAAADAGVARLPSVVIDLVPTAAETPLCLRARTEDAPAGRRTVDGLAMLLHQAARSFTLWTGREAPLGVMAAALPRPARAEVRT